MAENRQSIIHLDRISKRYGALTVLREFSLDIGPGEFVSLIGPSGSGKTTVLRILAGLTEATEGRLLKAPEAAKLAYIFQDATLLPWRTARRNVELPLELAGESSAQCREHALELLAKVGLGEAVDKYPRQLSGGMKMRVSLARALSTEPALLLLDEPFGALDAMARNRLNEELLRLRESQPFTAVFVTHSVTEAVFLSNRIVVLSPEGRIAAVEEVPFAYPRGADLRAEAGYYELVARVTASLQDSMEGSACA